VRAAVQLLDVSGFHPDDRRSETGTSNPEALASFQAAEALMNQPDFRGVEAAVEKYKQAVVIDSRYALAYARMALAYSQLYFMHRNASAIVLGKANAETSVALDRDLIEGHVSLAWLFEDTGDRANALREMGKALTLDPANPKTLIYQAQIFSRMNRWEDADNVFKKVLMKRPNYWLAWNERGWNYYSQGRYLLALEAFKVASFSAPKNAFALYNVGSLEFRLGRPDEALECLRKSMAAKPNDNAASTMAEVFRSQGKYAEALQASTLAVNLNPSDSTNWLEFGDCSSLVHGHSADAKAAYAHAVAAQEEQLLTNPTRGPDWMLLALYKVKTGKPSGVPSLIDKAESLNAMDIDSQLYKARILELLGERDKALATLALCMAKGATRYQIESIADLESLRKDERYLKLVSNGLANTVGQNT
jgi:tetratricopeptide (TPR) repeat protein